MEQFDRDKAQRVWQRVQPQSAQSGELSPSPEGFVLEELMAAEGFLLLARQEKEPANGPLRRLAEQARERAEILKGICRLMGLDFPGKIPKPAGPENLQPALRRHMGGLIRHNKQYARLAEQGEFALLYQALARKVQDSACLLAQTIGK